MTQFGYTLFDTPIGRCGMAWGRRGIVCLQLPEAREDETQSRLLKQCPEARQVIPPAKVQRAIDSVVALLHGKPTDLSRVALDMEGLPPFHRRVYDVARRIAPGATLSYGEVAALAGAPGGARAVGQALGRNPFAIIVPCHRVLSAGGKIGGFSANGGVSTKRRLLAIEGVKANGVSAKPPPIAVTSTPPTAVTSTPPSLFGFDATLALKQLSKSDPILGRLIDKVGSFEMPLNATHSLFMALAEAIVYQQLTAKAAGTIFARVCALFPDHKAGFTPAHVLSASEAVLRGAGLSRAKYLALQDLARKAEQGTIPSVAEAQRLDNEAIIERLTPVRGVGRWTVEMLLMFRLGRIDVLPLDDYGIRKGFAVAFKKRELPAKAVIEKRGKRWKPYRTIASWYLWRAAEFKA